MSECRAVAKELIDELIRNGKCTIAEIAGSLRRGEEYTHDVDIVCADPTLPKEKQVIKRFKKNSCSIDLDSANPVHFGAMLLTYTGPKGSNIGMRIKAKKKGMKLNQYGLYKNHDLIASETEEEIYSALGKSWKPPELRGK